MPVSFGIEEARTYLDAKPSWIILTTIGRDGYPHSVPIGYFRLGDEVYIGCRTGTQKLKNIERNPKVSLLVQSGSSMQDIKGLMIRGDATIFAEPDDLLRLGREAARVRGVPEDELPTEGRPGAAYIRVPLANITTWDYSRQA